MKSKKQRKALRSAAARKGWATRRIKRDLWRLTQLVSKPEFGIDPAKALAHFFPQPPPLDPNPWPRIAAWIKARWHAVFG